MRTKAKRRYSEEFKRDTVQLLESSDKPVTQISREMGIHESQLYKWRRQYGQKGKESQDGSSREELAAEVKHLRREVVRLGQERDILKKAISIFSRERR